MFGSTLFNVYPDKLIDNRTMSEMIVSSREQSLERYSPLRY